ncbi:MAG: hypothetical protein RLZZ182_613, partial [Pseudomonadota bacterium]
MPATRTPPPSPSRSRSVLAVLCGITLVLVLAACGGGKGHTDTTSTPPLDQAAAVSLPQVPARPATDEEAARFLEQATFGPKPADIDHLKEIGYAAWIDEQLSLPPSPTHTALYQQGNAVSGGLHQFNHTFWQKALTSPDQLRQRMTYALSQIFVVSYADSCGANAHAGLISYYDLLERQAFGAYRQLLQGVTLHPVMG